MTLIPEVLRAHAFTVLIGHARTCLFPRLLQMIVHGSDWLCTSFTFKSTHTHTEISENDAISELKYI